MQGKMKEVQSSIEEYLAENKLAIPEVLAPIPSEGALTAQLNQVVLQLRTQLRFLGILLPEQE